MKNTGPFDVSFMAKAIMTSKGDIMIMPIKLLKKSINRFINKFIVFIEAP